MQNRNETKSSVLQALLDLQTIAVKQNNDAIVLQTEALIKALPNKLLKEANQKFESRRYNDNKLTFAQVKNYKTNQIINDLSAKACKLLLFVIQNVPQTNLIELKPRVLMEILNMSDKTISESIEELKDFGLLTVVQNPVKRKGLGCIYQLNPDFATTGKPKLTMLFKEKTQKLQIESFENHSNCDFCVLKGSIVIDDIEWQFNTISLD